MTFFIKADFAGTNIVKLYKTYSVYISKRQSIF